MLYRVRYLAKTGEIREDNLFAYNKDELLQQIKAKGHVIEIKTTAKQKKFTKLTPEEERVILTKIASNLESGANLADAIALAGDMESQKISTMLHNMKAAVGNGKSLSQACRAAGVKWSKEVVDFIAEGEKAGELKAFIDTLARSIGRNINARKKIKGVLAYPTTLLTFSFIITMTLIVFALPSFEKLLIKSRATDVPWLSQILLDISHAITAHPFEYAGIILSTVFLAFKIVQTKTVNGALKTFLLKTPKIGKFYKRIITARFAERLGLFLMAGTPIDQAIEKAGAGCKNPAITKITGEIKNKIADGGDYIELLTKTGIFDVELPNSLQAGREQGKVSEKLLELSARYYKDIEIESNIILKTIEPVMVFLVLLPVAFVLLGGIMLMYFSYNSI